MSEQNAELTSVESGSLNAGPAVPHLPDPWIQPVVAAPDLVPGQGAEVEAPKADTAKTEPSAGEPAAPSRH